MSQRLEQLLSDREKHILRTIAKGQSSKQVANTLGISKHTVDTHRRNMIRKTKVSNIIQLINKAHQEGWLDN